MLAVELCLAGVRPLVLERQPAIRQTPKALGVAATRNESTDSAAAGLREALRFWFGDPSAPVSAQVANT